MHMSFVRFHTDGRLPSSIADLSSHLLFMCPHRVEGIFMQKQAVIFNGQEVGIVIPSENRLKFIAVRFHVIGLDNRLFDTVTDVRRAITEHLASGKSSPAVPLH